MPAEPGAPSTHPVVAAAQDFLSRFEKTGTILVAVSGGSDSTGLLVALVEAIGRGEFPDFTLAACTVDHALRPGSANEAQTVATLCATLGIHHLTLRWEGAKPANGMLAAAREARYRLLCEAAQTAGAMCIVTGHTAGDQAETIAMRRSRSDVSDAGLTGMADGVLVHAKHWVLRPFLQVGRLQIRNYLQMRGQGWFDDPSNSNIAFERVRVRENVPAVDINLTEDAVGRRKARSIAVAGFLSRHVEVYGGLVVCVDPNAFAVPIAEDSLRAMLMLAAVIGGKAYPAGREQAQRIAKFLDGGKPGRLTVSRVVFDRRKSGLYLYRESRDVPHIVVPAGESSEWDGRFTVSNRASRSLHVEAGGDEVVAALIGSGVPEAIAERAKAGCPTVGFAAGEIDCDADDASYSANVVLKPFDTFLPRFDLIMANTLAELFGRPAYPDPPVRDVLTEKKAGT